MELKEFEKNKMTKSIEFRVPDDVYLRLKEMSKNGVNLSKLMRKLLMDFLGL